MAERCAVVGVGQTHHTKVRDDVSLAGLLREAAQPGPRRRRDDLARHRRRRHRHRARHVRGRDDARAVPGRRAGRGGQADAARAHRRQRRAAATAIVAVPPRHRRACASGCSPSRSRSSPRATPPGRLGGGRSGSVGAGGYFAPHIRGYIERSKAPEYVGWMVAVKDRKNALKNPYAHLKVPDISLEMVQRVPDGVGPGAPPRVLPGVRRRLRDGAHRRGRRRRRVEAAGLGARHRDAQRARPVPRPRPGQPARRARTARPTSTARPASPNPLDDVDMVECYVPFSWYEPMWMENLGLRRRWATAGS